MSLPEQEDRWSLAVAAAVILILSVVAGVIWWSVGDLIVQRLNQPAPVESR